MDAGRLLRPLATLTLWPEPPERDVALRFRSWAFESAALDLALSQAGRSLYDVLGLEPHPPNSGVTCVQLPRASTMVSRKAAAE